MEYKVVRELSTIALASVVNQLCCDGWEPVGGVALAFGDSGRITECAQAMVRRPPPVKPPTASGTGKLSLGE